MSNKINKNSIEAKITASEKFVKEQIGSSLPSDDTNMLMLPRSKKKAPEKKSAPRQTMTKNEARKLKQLMKKKKIQAENKELLKSLKETQLTNDQLQLLKPVHNTKLTRSELMKKAEMFIKTGVKIDENDEDYKKVLQRIKTKYATSVEEVDWDSVFPTIEEPTENSNESTETKESKTNQLSGAILQNETDLRENTINKPEEDLSIGKLYLNIKSNDSITSSNHVGINHNIDSIQIASSTSTQVSSNTMNTINHYIATNTENAENTENTTNTVHSTLNPKKPFIVLDFFGTSSTSQVDIFDASSEDTSSGEDEDDNSDFDVKNVDDLKDFEDIVEIEKQSTQKHETIITEDQHQTQKRKREDRNTFEPRKKFRRWYENATQQFSEFESSILDRITDEECKTFIINQLHQLQNKILGEDPDEIMTDIFQEETIEQNAISQATLNPFKDPSKRPGFVLKEIKKAQEDDTKIIKDILDNQIVPEHQEQKRRFYIHVDRDPKIQESRLKLPVCGEEQEIMEKILENDVVIICGETGSGKTTQVPQFLYEYGFSDERSGYPGYIGVTQPRRIAAISTAKRVAEELNVPFGSKVSYHVRYDNNMSDQTQLKFMTDGVLLKEIQSDFLLSQYSSLLLDEAHERNVNTDILIGMLSRVIPERNKRAREGEIMPNGKKITPLKLLIMSATLRVDDFIKNTQLFPPERIPVVINVQSRQYPVDVHFSKHTAFFNYVGAAVKKTIKIHEKCPPGGILIFLTGKQEIDHCVKKLKEYSEKKESSKEAIEPIHEGDASNIQEDEEDKINRLGNLSSDDENDNDSDSGSEEEYDPEIFPDSTAEDAITTSEENNISTTITLFKDSIKDEKLIEEGKEIVKKMNRSKKCTKLYVLPLYSMLNPKEQLKVFQPAPPGHRLCVVATNVAETSLTIPNIRYVIDPGRVKEREYDNLGVSKMVVQWTSQAGANQRAGRAGRTGPGHVYRLYSSAVFQDKFKPFFDPEIVKTPIDNVVLQMKTMGISNIESFPLPTAPPISTLKKATKNLVQLQALKLEDKSQISDPVLVTKITKLGKKMAEFPLDPKLSKMLIMAKKTSVLSHIVAIVSALSVEYLLMHSFSISDIYDKYKSDGNSSIKKAKLSEEDEKLKEMILESKKLFSDPFSDHLSLLKAVGAYQHSNGSESFCEQHFIHIKNMREVYKLAHQLTSTVLKQMKNVSLKLHKKSQVVKLVPPTPVQDVQIRQIICSSFITQIAKKVVTEEEMNNLSHEGRLTENNRPYITLSLGQNVPVYIHPSSNLHGINPKFVVFTELIETDKGRYYMRGVSSIEESWLHTYGGSLVKFSKPLSDPSPYYNQEKDALYCYLQPYFGENSEWKLSYKKQMHLHQNSSEIDSYFNWFASLFIQGKIFEGLPSKKEMLHSTKELRQGHVVSKNAIEIVERLKRVCIKEKKIVPNKTLIKQLWKKDKNFLKKEYLSFVKDAHKELVQSIWPPEK